MRLSSSSWVASGGWYVPALRLVSTRMNHDTLNLLNGLHTLNMQLCNPILLLVVPFLGALLFHTLKVDFGLVVGFLSQSLLMGGCKDASLLCKLALKLDATKTA